MRFVTYKNQIDSNLHFGFLDKEMIFDINLLSTWFKDKDNQNQFLSIAVFEINF